MTEKREAKQPIRNENEHKTNLKIQIFVWNNNGASHFFFFGRCRCCLLFAQVFCISENTEKKEKNMQSATIS